MIRHNPGGNEHLAYLQDKVISELLDRGRLQQPQKFFLKLLPGPVRREAVARLLLGPTPTAAHWRNILNPMRFSFPKSRSFRFIELLVATLGVVTLWQLWLALHADQAGWLRWLPWFEGAGILLAAGLVVGFDRDFDPAKRGDLSALDMLGILVLGPVVAFVAVQALAKREENAFIISFFVILASMAVPSVAVRDTIAFHHWTGSWPATVAIWLSLGALVGFLILMGRRKERLARNPLEGLQLEAASAR